MTDMADCRHGRRGRHGRHGRPDRRSRAPAVACTTEQTQLGEGTRWDARRDELLRVDILAGRVYRDRVTPRRPRWSRSGRTTCRGRWVRSRRSTATTAGCWPRGRGSSTWLATARSRTMVDVDGAGVADERRRVRPAGTAVGGHASPTTTIEGGGALVRLDRDGGSSSVLDGLTIPNGMGWSSDEQTMYLIDSGPRTIRPSPSTRVGGAITEERVLVAVPEGSGLAGRHDRRRRR